MKKARAIGIVALLAAGLAGTSPAAAQGELERWNRASARSNGPLAMAAADGQRAYLGAFAVDDAGRGVRLSSVRSGGPADSAGLHAHDLIVGAAGRKIHLLSELSTILNSSKPGDHLMVEFIRGNQPLHTEVVLGLRLARHNWVARHPLPNGLGAGRTESIPPPPGEVRRPRPRGRHSASPLRNRSPPAIPRPRSTSFAAESISWSARSRSWNGRWPSRSESKLTPTISSTSRRGAPISSTWTRPVYCSAPATTKPRLMATNVQVSAA